MPGLSGSSKKFWSRWKLLARVARKGVCSGEPSMSRGVGVGVRRRVTAWAAFGLSLGFLVAGPGTAQAAAPALPTGGKVVAGRA